ncbi:sigma 54-interacting transcriptional regulator [bacterium]|nr:sigma 54-interacting transcriptional regulator [bacterium]
MQWAQLPWLENSHDGATVIQLSERLLESVQVTQDEKTLLAGQLPEVATELGAQWVAVMHRTPAWVTLGEFGRHTLDDLPMDVCADALDKEAAAWHPTGAGWSLLTVPLRSGMFGDAVLIAAGRSLPSEILPTGLCVGRVLALALGLTNQHSRSERRLARLQSTLQIASSFAAETETQPLLELIALEATKLLECDRSSIFLWDKKRKEVVACPALGVEGDELRLPDSAGIVGETLRTGESIRVDDAYQDDRFNQDVDKQSGYKTQSLLCVPLLDAKGKLIGAFEGINSANAVFSADDEESLRELGTQAAIALQNIKQREQLSRSRDQLAEQVTDSVRIIGESAAMMAMRDTIDRLASTDLPVLILGESGTGKEVVSQALHYQGPRADQPFIAVNCAALTETLLESELFGHEKGAFTDARDMRRGKFELAEGGTLFLDEIGDMSANGQAKLLRVLEQKVITRVGGSQTIPINVRVLAATNANLTEAVREKKFREDLYYRLSVVTLELPPLRDRPEDILPLAEYFLKRFSVQAKRPSLQLSGDARRRLQAHSWPGNVRELRNLMERVAFLCTGERVETDDLAFILSPGQDSAFEPSLDIGLDKATKQFQREFVRRTVKRVGGNMSEAARMLGLHRSNLYRKMRQLDMSEVGGEE